MSGSIIIGGAYFTDDRINLIHEWYGSNSVEVNWKHLVDGRVPEVGEWVFFLGIKRWARKLKKARYPYKRIATKIAGYINKVAGNRPFGVLDDCNWNDEDKIGDRLRRSIPRCGAYLLREYVRNHEYPKWVHPFSIPSTDLGHYKKPSQIPISFYGAGSHGDRPKWVKRFKGVAPKGSVFTIYNHGEKSKEKLPREEYFSIIGQSKVALNLRGAGYCCFRYQEIPAVGSCLASPESPHVIRNDYQHLRHCIKFATVRDVLDNMDRAEDIAGAGHEHFLKYHTTEVRYNELAGYIDEVRGNKSL